jgi:hypothetical protein
MARLSLGQKAVLLGILGLIAVVGVGVLVFVDNVLAKGLALLALGTCLSMGYKFLHR